MVDQLDKIIGEKEKEYEGFILGKNELTIIIPINDYPYKIEWNTLKNERELLNWSIHLLEKRWVTKELLNAFIEIVNERQGFKLNTEPFFVRQLFSFDDK